MTNGEIKYILHTRDEIMNILKTLHESHTNRNTLNIYLVYPLEAKLGVLKKVYNDNEKYTDYMVNRDNLLSIIQVVEPVVERLHYLHRVYWGIE